MSEFEAETDAEELANAIEHIAQALLRLGTADAYTPMGALESHGLVVKEAAETIYNGLHEVAEAIEGHGNRVKTF